MATRSKTDVYKVRYVMCAHIVISTLALIVNVFLRYAFRIFVILLDES